ncbi:TIGR03085 family metal-binding protein [Nocardioides aequoreus]|uniref:TIGR03085 family metal-binding protein n=1 Tax=Nocardioides aequoreus TaxID=397278 RepID=UPI001B8089F9|nr:TIGR03085 family metal-binding protein [Nocardioides aequoreus]
MEPMSRTERAALCNSALEVGPDAPTLCAGWSTKDLVVHLLVRERDPVASVGIVLPPAAGLLERKSRKLARQDFTSLVERVRTGPPVWSPLRPAPVDRRVNTLELFVHHEDVRRAQPGWEPRELTDREQATLWKAIAAAGRAVARASFDGPLEIVWPRDHHGQERRTTLRAGGAGDPVALRGEPAELVLAVFGRDQHRAERTSG